jgi:carbamoyltransferase
MALTLGLQTGHEASAALFEGPRLLAALSDERISRIKNDGGRLTHTGLNGVLGIAGRAQSEIQRLALLYTFFPDAYVRRESWLKELERGWVRHRRQRAGAERPQLLLGNFLERLRARGQDFESHFRRDAFLRHEGFDPAASVRFFDHHASHALPAAWYSGFRECAVITMDGEGDRLSHTSGLWREGCYQRLHHSGCDGVSPGLFYSHITRLLGFQAMRHEGKVVGLAALGNADKLRAVFTRALRAREDGSGFTSDFAGQPQAEAARLAHLQAAIAGHSREDIAAAAQQVLEDAALNVVRTFLRATGQRRVTLNGGVFANVKLNQRIMELPEVDEIFVFPAMSDTGNSVGAVLLDWQDTHPEWLADNAPLDTVYWGPEYSPEQIAAALAAAGLHAERLGEAALVERAARAIHAGRVVGWFQGRMEFGPRALGNRSMLARPTENAINDWLNQRLDRSEFMPFAPSALAEHADALFDNVAKARHTAEFMTITFDVRPEWRERIPAVVHVDGTARPQLVRADRNPLYHRLISAYHALSGIPLVLNTSFNVHEEPIVCAPPEALRAFAEKRVDCLGIGPFWLAHPA